MDMYSVTCTWFWYTYLAKCVVTTGSIHIFSLMSPKLNKSPISVKTDVCVSVCMYIICESVCDHDCVCECLRERVYTLCQDNEQNLGQTCTAIWAAYEYVWVPGQRPSVLPLSVMPVHNFNWALCSDFPTRFCCSCNTYRLHWPLSFIPAFVEVDVGWGHKVSREQHLLSSLSGILFD